MTHPVRFKTADLDRALRVAERRGLGIAGYEITPDGTIRILTGEPQETHTRRNPLDRLHHG